jgi:hypothetical protein
MNRTIPVVGLLAIAVVAAVVLGIAGCSGPAESKEASNPSAGSIPAVHPETEGPTPSDHPSDKSGDAMAAFRDASEAGKYLFAFFWKTEDEQTRAMRTVFEQAAKKVSDRADSVAVHITDPSDQAIVDEYGLARAPMPLVLALAPNGAVTGGFPTEFTEEDIVGAFATPCTEKCMKSLQDGKLVFLCVQNANTEFNDEAMQGIGDFKADSRFADATEVVSLDPADSEEAGFLADLNIPADTANAVTVFLAPPGMPIAMYEGATDKDQLVKTLESAGSGCCPGGSCGPGGCGPGGCAPAQ